MSGIDYICPACHGRELVWAVTRRWDFKRQRFACSPNGQALCLTCATGGGKPFVSALRVEIGVDEGADQ